MAERVMGWRWQQRVGDLDCQWCFRPDAELREADGRTRNWNSLDGIVGTFEPCEAPDRRANVDFWYPRLPHYSTDVAAVWEVVEKLRTAGCRLALEDWGDATPCGGWCALFTAADGHDTGQHVGDTIPDAICRAALTAVLEATP